MAHMTKFDAKNYQGKSLTCVRGDRRVFVDLDFRVSSGEMLVLKGHNGSGKSSLLRVMAGLISPRGGSLTLDDISFELDPAFHRSAIVYAGHQAGLKPLMSLRENLLHYTHIVRGTALDEGEIEKACEALYLSHLVDEQLRYFSQGQTHRAALLKLMMSRRAIWLMDEPTVGLDADSRIALAGIMQSHLDDGGIIIVATHDPLGFKGRELILDAFQSSSQITDHWLEEDDLDTGSDEVAA